MGDEVNAKHTPGPWALGQPGAEQFEDVLVPDGKRVIWAPDGMEVALARDRGGETRANACLVAAAPELLAALKSFMRAPSLGSAGQGSITIEVQSYNRNAARAAIDKAEGVAE